MKRLFLVLFCLLLVPGKSQPEWKKQRDSIAKKIATLKPDTNKVLALLNYGWWWETYNMDSAAQCYLRMHELSQKINYVNGEIKYYGNYTFILNQQGKYNLSLKLNLQSIEFAKQKGSPEQIATCLFNAGSSYNNMAKYDEAIAYYLQAIKIFEELKLIKKTAVAYDNIGGIFSNIGQEEKGLTYHKKALEKATEINDSMEIATALLNIGTQQKVLNKLMEAENTTLKALTIAKQIKSTYLEINANLTLAEIFVKQNLFDKSIAYAKLGLERAIAIDSKYSQMEALKILTRCYYLNKNYTMAIQLGEEAIVFGKKNNIVSELYKVYELVAQEYAQINNYKLAYQNLSISKDLKDSINDQNLTKEIEQLEIKYQTAKKEKQILELEHTKNQQQLLIMSLIVGITIVLCIIYLVYKNYSQKRKLLVADTLYKQHRIQELETEKKLIISQSIIKGQEEERTRLAKDLHDGLGGILSSAKYAFSNLKNNLSITEESTLAFENGLTILDTSIRELRRVAHNMMPEALVKFGLNTALQDFCEVINKNSALQLTYQSFDLKDEDVSNNKVSTIYRIIQELVNNIIKHAHAKTALVQFIKKNNTLSITVEDDGKGFDISILKNNTGIGYSNLYSRVAYINGKIDVQTELGKGTSINIELPNISHD